MPVYLRIVGFWVVYLIILLSSMSPFIIILLIFCRVFLVLKLIITYLYISSSLYSNHFIIIHGLND